jgi:sorbitol-specific phosphotransferase system component IIC
MSKSLILTVYFLWMGILATLVPKGSCVTELGISLLKTTVFERLIRDIK